MKKRILFVMGVWCSGKTTNFNYILSEYSDDVCYVPSYTTRDMREWEINGQRYRHISADEFDTMIFNNERLEYASAPWVHRGKYYGTRKSDIDTVIAQDKIPIKETEVIGLHQLLNSQYAHEYEIITIFLNISDDEMRKRIRLRQSDMSWEDIEQRILHTQHERDFAQQYCTYIVDASPALSIVQSRLRQIMDAILEK